MSYILKNRNKNNNRRYLRPKLKKTKIILSFYNNRTQPGLEDLIFNDSRILLAEEAS